MLESPRRVEKPWGYELIWAETDEDIIQFDMDREQSGPLPVSVLVSAFGELSTNINNITNIHAYIIKK